MPSLAPGTHPTSEDSHSGSDATDFLPTLQQGNVRHRVTQPGPAYCAAHTNMFLKSLYTEKEHSVLFGRVPETYDGVWSMPRTDTKASLGRRHCVLLSCHCPFLYYRFPDKAYRLLPCTAQALD